MIVGLIGAVTWNLYNYTVKLVIRSELENSLDELDTKLDKKLDELDTRRDKKLAKLHIEQQALQMQNRLLLLVIAGLLRYRSVCAQRACAQRAHERGSAVEHEH